MLGDNKSVLDKPEILRREATLEPVKRGKRRWFKVIVILIVVVLIIYFFMRAGGIEGIRDFADNFLDNLLK